MVATRTTDDLVAEVNDQALLPAADGRLSSAEKLRMADRIMRTDVAALLVTARSGWWVTAAADVPVVSGVYLYSVPERALAEGLADLLIARGDSESSAPEIPASEAWRYREQHGGWDSPFAYTWRDDKVELLPHPMADGYSLRMLYPRRPSSLVAVADCALVASVASTVITTAATVPAAWGSAETLDLVSAINGRPRVEDAAGSSIAATSVTVSAGLPLGLVAGDYVCLDGETCVPPVPDSVWPVLVDGATRDVLRAIGHHQGAMAAAERMGESVASARDLLTPRSRGAVRRIVAHNSPLRRGRRR